MVVVTAAVSLSVPLTAPLTGHTRYTPENNEKCVPSHVCFKYVKRTCDTHIYTCVYTFSVYTHVYMGEGRLHYPSYGVFWFFLTVAAQL